MSDPIKLDKVITIDGQDYEVYAVRSDTSGNADNAEKVSNKLTLSKSTYNTNTKKQSEVKIFDYDGSNEKALAIVPASGGAFTGPVYIAHTSEDGTTAYEKVTNEAGVSSMIPPVVENIVQQLKGVPGWSWDGEKASQLDSDSTISKLDMIIGKKEHVAGNSLLSLCNDFVYFLFFCVDTGDIFLRNNRDNTELIKLIKSVDFATNATNATNAEKADKATSIVGAVFNKTVNYSAIDIYNALVAIQTNLNSITNIIKGDTIVPRATYLYEPGKYEYSAEDLYETKVDVANIKNGKTTVPKAQKDSSDNIICNNYYLKNNASYKNQQNTITIDHRDPRKASDWGTSYKSDACNNGDIWILVPPNTLNN